MGVDWSQAEAESFSGRARGALGVGHERPPEAVRWAWGRGGIAGQHGVRRLSGPREDQVCELMCHAECSCQLPLQYSGHASTLSHLRHIVVGLHQGESPVQEPHTGFPFMCEASASSRGSFPSLAALDA